MISDAIDSLFDKIANFFYDLVYRIGTFILKLLKLLYQLFEVFSGSRTVRYAGGDEYLINVFFNSKTVNVLYAGMAVIGFVILLVMTIIAVARKSVDVDDKMQAPLGTIIRKLLSSFLLIISMNFIMIVTINFSNVLMQSVQFLFDNAGTISENTYHEFTDKEYAAMARIYNTIGNYSLNDSYRSRFNLNSCYNEIRADMYYLQNQGVFDYSYADSVGGLPVQSWQSVLAKIEKAHDISKDMPLDEYDSSLSMALINAMQYVKQNNNEMTVLQYYYIESVSAASMDATLDVSVFLAATSRAAHNDGYNGDSVSFSDSLRAPYISGEKSIYDIDTVKEDFSLAFSDFDHLIVIIGGIIFIEEFFALCLNCVARIFNMLLLYIMAPPFIATAPLDDGAKFKQWKVAFVIQCFNVFGTVVSMRLLIMLFPIIFGWSLRLVGNGFFEMVAKVILAIGAVYTARKASGLFTGILSENAGYQSIMAGDVASSVKQSGFGKAYEGVKGAAGAVAGAALKGGWNLLKAPFTGGGKKDSGEGGGGGAEKKEGEESKKEPENKNGSNSNSIGKPENNGKYSKAQKDKFFGTDTSKGKGPEGKGPDNKGKGPEGKEPEGKGPEGKGPEGKGSENNGSGNPTNLGAQNNNSNNGGQNGQQGEKLSFGQRLKNLFSRNKGSNSNGGSKGNGDKGSGQMVEMQDLGSKSEQQPQNLNSQVQEDKEQGKENKEQENSNSNPQQNSAEPQNLNSQNQNNKGQENKEQEKKEEGKKSQENKEQKNQQNSNANNSKAQPNTNQSSNSTSKAQPNTNANSNSASKAQPNTNANSNSASKAQPNTNANSNSASKAQPNTNANSNSASKAQPNTNANSNSASKAQPNQSSNSTSKAQPNANANSNSNSKAQPNTNANSNSSQPSQVQTNSNTNTGSNTKPNTSANTNKVNNSKSNTINTSNTTGTDTSKSGTGNTNTSAKNINVRDRSMLYKVRISDLDKKK